MSANLLILGGTTEASSLAKAVAKRKLKAVFSYAGRVNSPREQPIPQRVGGFGGVDGLAAYLRDNNITHVIDATHPFAAKMSWNAYNACTEAGVPLLAFTRPPWVAKAGDEWVHVSDMYGAVAAVSGTPKRVMLALGRLHMEEFAAAPDNHYVLRLVDEPKIAPKLPDHSVIVARGPFTTEADIALFKEQRIDMVVCKNAGGKGAEAKVHAARELGLPMVMIDRPDLPPRDEVATVKAVFDWIDAH